VEALVRVEREGLRAGLASAAEHTPLLFQHAALHTMIRQS
jgi:hypothetical protein